MLKFMISVLFVVLLALGTLSEDNATSSSTLSTSIATSDSGSTSPAPSSSTSSAPSSSTSSAPSSSTSSAPSSSTSSAPSTSSTAAPTSPTTEASTSTVQPTSAPSTPVPPVTTPAPEFPKPTKGNWTVTEGNTTCIRAEMAVLFTIPLAPNRTAYIALSPNASADNSNCETSNTTQTLVLSDLTYTFSLEFKKDDKQVSVKEVKLSYNVEGFSDSVQSNETRFAVTNGKSYLCNANKTFTINNVTISLTEVHLQAFGKEENTGFTAYEECDADDDVSQIVPIAVGCALAALVVVVLIAYLVGRRRSRQKGYQSV